ncbi:hypothetical protein [Roseovarius sp. MMSF_3281]|uniref:hypothetical protein n=1 Tax=Roseovarius sp. MMSF_3281 TaxID=3046694 RepID=UPI00273DD705|nr:hypothetical protein [Roseovarius sp. MMSF_3281]
MTESLIHKRIGIEGGDLVIETVSEAGPMTHTDRFSIGLNPDQAYDLFLELDEHFNLAGRAPKLLPRKVFEALPPEDQQDVMARGYQLYDYPEHLDDDALEYDIKLRARG